MKLAHAIKVAEQILHRAEQIQLKQDERIAIRVLIRMGARVADAKPSLRAIVRAVYGEDLNQTELDELFKQE